MYIKRLQRPGNTRKMSRVQHRKQRIARSLKPDMTYYEKLINQAEKSIHQHPKSTVVVNARTFSVLAVGQDVKKITERLKGTEPDTVLAIFERPRGHQLALGFTKFLGCR